MYLSIYIYLFIYIRIYIYIVHVSWGISESSSGFPPTDQYEGWVPSEFPGRFVLFPGPIGQGPPEIRHGQEGYPKIWHGRL